MHSDGFSPIADPSAQVLVLGTLPGQASLLLQQYYGQPQNAFWKIMGALVGAGPELPFEARIQILQNHGIALWDVCAAAFRPGSLDASISAASVVPNDFCEFFREHPGIKLVCFNGAKAEALYRRLVMAALEADPLPTYVVLPSTSPANTGMSFAQKLERWSVILEQTLTPAIKT